MTHCDNSRCEHNEKLICTLPDRYIVDDSCVSRRKKQQEEDYKELMKNKNPLDFQRCQK